MVKKRFLFVALAIVGVCLLMAPAQASYVDAISINMGDDGTGTGNVSGPLASPYGVVGNWINANAGVPDGDGHTGRGNIPWVPPGTPETPVTANGNYVGATFSISFYPSGYWGSQSHVSVDGNYAANTLGNTSDSLAGGHDEDWLITINNPFATGGSLDNGQPYEVWVYDNPGVGNGGPFTWRSLGRSSDETHSFQLTGKIQWDSIAAVQILQIRALMVTVADGDWVPAATWDANRTPLADDDTEVQHNVVVSAPGGVAQQVLLSQAASRLTVNPGATLNVGSGAGTVEVKNGILSATSGGLTAITLNVTGGAASVAGACWIGTVNASAGTANLGTNVTTALNVSDTGTVTTITPVSVPTVTVSGGTLNLGLIASDLSVNNVTVSGTGAINTQNCYLLVGNSINMDAGTSISTTGPAFGVKGSAVTSSIASIETLKLDGGTVTISVAGPKEVIWSESFETDGEGTRYTSNRLNEGTPTGQHWGRTQSLPAGAFGTAIVPADGSYQWSGANTSTIAGSRDEGLGSRNASWLDFNAMSVAGKTGLQLTVDVYAGEQNVASNDVFEIKVINGVNAYVIENIRGTAYDQDGHEADTWYTSSINGTELSPAGTVKSMTYDLSGLGLTGDMQLRFIHAQDTDLNEFIAFDNLKLWADTFGAMINLPTTDVELADDTWLDLGDAPGAAFGDLIPAGCPNGTTLRILGTNPTTYLVLAYYWDNVAPHASSFTQTANGDDGSSFWVELTYTGGAAIPEPAGLGLIGAALLMLRRRRS